MQNWDYSQQYQPSPYAPNMQANNALQAHNYRMIEIDYRTNCSIKKDFTLQEYKEIRRNARKEVVQLSKGELVVQVTYDREIAGNKSKTIGSIINATYLKLFCIYGCRGMVIGYIIQYTTTKENAVMISESEFTVSNMLKGLAKEGITILVGRDRKKEIAELIYDYLMRNKKDVVSADLDGWNIFIDGHWEYKKTEAFPISVLSVLCDAFPVLKDWKMTPGMPFALVMRNNDNISSMVRKIHPKASVIYSSDGKNTVNQKIYHANSGGLFIAMPTDLTSKKGEELLQMAFDLVNKEDFSAAVFLIFRGYVPGNLKGKLVEIHAEDVNHITSFQKDLKSNPQDLELIRDRIQALDNENVFLQAIQFGYPTFIQSKELHKFERLQADAKILWECSKNHADTDGILALFFMYFSNFLEESTTKQILLSEVETKEDFTNNAIFLKPGKMLYMKEQVLKSAFAEVLKIIPYRIFMQGLKDAEILICDIGGFVKKMNCRIDRELYRPSMIAFNVERIKDLSEGIDL